MVERARKNFTETLREIRDGELVTELTAKVRELVEAVRATQKGGTLALKLTLKPMKKGMDVMILEDEVKLVLPEPDKDCSTVMFPTTDNELTRRDPRQPDLPGVRGVVSAMPTPAERAADQNG
jgi:hypothetical protein